MVMRPRQTSTTVGGSLFASTVAAGARSEGPLELTQAAVLARAVAIG
jgi:hypothetical protein